MADPEENTNENEEATDEPEEEPTTERRDPITLLGINANGHLMSKVDTTAGFTLRINNEGHLEVVYSE